MDQIRKIIREAVAKVIEEDYSSIKEIKDLANQILIFAGKVNSEYVNRQFSESNNESMIYLYPVKLIDVYQENAKLFTSLGNFITNSNVMIQFIVTRKENGTLGNYGFSAEKEFDTTRSRSIRLFYGKSMSEKLWKDKNEYRVVDGKDLYFTFWYAFHSTLEHELQHAYDDYRSNSHVFLTKGYEKFVNKYSTENAAEIDSDFIKSSEKNKQYLRLQHEINARFTQAINNIHFTDSDFRETIEGVPYLTYTMKPIEKLLRDFKYEFSGWNAMTDKTKKNLYRKVSQYWHKEQEGLSTKNKLEIDKAKNYIKNT